MPDTAELSRSWIKAAPAAPQARRPRRAQPWRGPPGARRAAHSAGKPSWLPRRGSASAAQPSSSAPDYPAGGHRVNGGPTDRRMRSAAPTIDPAPIRTVTAPVRTTDRTRDRLNMPSRPGGTRRRRFVRPRRLSRMNGPNDEADGDYISAHKQNVRDLLNQFDDAMDSAAAFARYPRIVSQLQIMRDTASGSTRQCLPSQRRPYQTASAWTCC